MAKSVWKKVFGWTRRSGAESRRFGGYHIVKLIHEGEKSLVHEARSLDGSETVAIKAYKPLYNRTARRICKRYHLRREGELGLLINPHARERQEDWPIVRTIAHGHEFGEPSRCYYVVLEHINGLNVKHLLGCDDPLLARLRMPIVMAVARALSIIHERGLIHRDVATDNVMLTRDHQAKLIDLGFMAPAGIAFKEKSGTPSYMAPEQFQVRPLHAATDIYAFGIMLFELFTKRLPFTTPFSPGNPDLAMRRASELMVKHVKERPPRPSESAPDLPEGMEPIILKCLEKKPQDRHHDIRAVMGELSKVRDPAGEKIAPDRRSQKEV